MKKMGILIVFFVFLTNGFIFAQENDATIDEDAVCRPYSGSSETDDEIEVEFGDINSSNKLAIKVRNRIRNQDIEITRVVVKGKDSKRKTITETFRRSDISFSNDFKHRILDRSKSGKITVKLNEIKTVTEVTVHADVCEL